jgi:hypothetical protein
MTAQVSANGRGQNFVAATVTKNGDRAPARAGNQQITAKLPANTRCTGGTAGNRCLVVSPTFRFRVRFRGSILLLVSPPMLLRNARLRLPSEAVAVAAAANSFRLRRKANNTRTAIPQRRWIRKLCCRPTRSGWCWCWCQCPTRSEWFDL